jgi:hypothetical protein
LRCVKESDTDESNWLVYSLKLNSKAFRKKIGFCPKSRLRAGFIPALLWFNVVYIFTRVHENKLEHIGARKTIRELKNFVNITRLNRRTVLSGPHLLENATWRRYWRGALENGGGEGEVAAGSGLAKLLTAINSKRFSLSCKFVQLKLFYSIKLNLR